MINEAYKPGGWGLQPPDSGKAIIFRTKAKFVGQKPAAKNEKNCRKFFGIGGSAPLEKIGPMIMESGLG